MTESVPELVAELSAEVAVSRAAVAARSGRLAEAESILRDLPDLDHQPAAVDLLARVHAQRGEWEAADRCWARLRELDPGNGDAAAGRALIARIRSGECRARPLVASRAVGFAAVLIGVLAVAGLVAGLVVGPRLADSRAAPPRPAGPMSMPMSMPAGAPPASQAGAGRLVAPASQSPAASAPDGVAVHALAQRLAMPGVRVTEEPGQVRVVFEQGLFVRGSQLSSAGTRLLASLGRRLIGARASIVVVGHTVAVPGGPASGGSVVALARALVAARERASASGVPITGFSLRSADQARPLFAEPARNRTVTLLVSPG